MTLISSQVTPAKKRPFQKIVQFKRKIFGFLGDENVQIDEVNVVTIQY
jgi:hypothetical protein